MNETTRGMSAHTPGPWTVGRVVGDDELAIASSRGEIGSLYPVNGSERERDANAARIVACVNACEGIADPSAVPDLLAALRGCADSLKEAGKAFALANLHAARPNLYELHEDEARAAIARAEGSQ